MNGKKILFRENLPFLCPYCKKVRIFCAYFTKEKVDNYDKAAASDLDAFSAYFGKMLDNGVYVAPSQFEAMFVSAAHTEKEIAKTCDLIMNL